MNWKTTFASWQEHLRNSAYQPQLDAYQQDDAAAEEAFYRELEFGTAGMRGVLGLGTNMMNVFTVARATQGLAAWLLERGQATDGVAIAYDSRHMSAEFAKVSALTLAANGVKVYLYDRLTSVPQLSFAVLQLHAAAGVVITASHNPPKYNGYKVYGPGGGQLTDRDAAAVTAKISAVRDPFAIKQISEAEAIASGLLSYVGDELYEQYYQQVLQLCPEQELLRQKAAELNIVYTPLHGTGLQPVTAVLARLGFSHLSVVEQQREPDGAFPTVSAPNPEDPAAFALAEQLANQVGADLLIATDPDCDRMGLSVRLPQGGFCTLSGNQIGCLLLEYLLERRQNGLRGDEFAVRSIVSSPLADRIAAHYGVEMRVVLTGFKYIAEQISRSASGGQGRFLFGFEESYGYLAGDFVRDKDACIAAMLAASAACYYQQRGWTLYDALQALEQKYGCFTERVVSVTREGQAGLAGIKQAMRSLREQPLHQLNGLDILSAQDYLDSAATGLPPADVLRYQLASGSLILRPSGTEPKLKAYIAAQGATAQESQARFGQIEDAVRQLLNKLLP